MGNMKRSFAVIGGLLVLVFLTSAASAQDAELAAPVKQCIDQNAASVERAIPSLTEATAFLVESVCADTIAAEQARLSRVATQKMVDHYQQECAAAKQPLPKSSDPDEAAQNPCIMAKSMSDMYSTSGFTIFAGTRQPEPMSTSYAAKLLLSLRLAHMKSNP